MDRFKKYLNMEKVLRLCILSIVVFLIVTDASSQDIKGTFAIKNVKTGIFLRIKDANKSDGTPLVAYSPVNWKCATWDFNHVDGRTYQLKNLFTSKTFQINNPTPTAGVSLEQRPFSLNQANQQYEFIPVKKNTYLIRLKNTELYITPSDNTGTINSPIILAKKDGTDLQYWTLHEQKPEI
jgi:hypothetical protein